MKCKRVHRVIIEYVAIVSQRFRRNSRNTKCTNCLSRGRCQNCARSALKIRTVHPVAYTICQNELLLVRSTEASCHVESLEKSDFPRGRERQRERVRERRSWKRTRSVSRGCISISTTISSATWRKADL